MRNNSGKPKGKPNDPLINIQINQLEKSMVSENRHLTCFQRRRLRPNVPPPRRCRMSKPERMNRSKEMPAIIEGMKSGTL